MISFRILGPIEAWAGERPATLGGRRQLALVAFLLLHANRTVSSDAVTDAVWGSARNRADNRLPMAIARLRRALEPLSWDGEPRLPTVSGGYKLLVRPGELDAELFASQVLAGRRALDEGETSRAAELLEQALGLWRGPALAQVAFEDFAQPEIRRLEELRLAAIEDRVDAELQLGRHARIVGDLEALVGEHPTLERLAWQLMLALYRCGRQADALEVYQRTRSHLAQQLGLEPNHALRTLQLQILEQAPSLEPATVGPAGGPAAVASPLTSLRALPVAPTATVGRGAEIEAIRALFATPEVRLVTLTGSGGVGKTRVALEVAHALQASSADGVCWVELAGVARSEDVASTILRGLAVAPVPGERTEDALRRYLAARELLLVIDNFEHVLDAAELIGELHAACPKLRMLITSREALNLAAEHQVVVAPLAVPTPSAKVSVEEIESTGASALFVASARRHDSRFSITPDTAPPIARICARLDGLPLALELAAARTRLLGVEELVARLDEMRGGLGSGSRDAPARQRTLDATIEWSYRPLDIRLKTTFAHFAVFAGGATLEAAETITGAPQATIEALIAKNLFARRPQTDGSTRLVMLETVRQYALERLGEDPGRRAVHQAHQEYYLRFAEQAAARLSSRDEREAVALIDAEIDNVRAALRSALEASPPSALRLAGALGEYWEIRGDGLPWLDAALQAAGERAPAGDRARALVARARQLLAQYQLADASESGTTALELYRAVDDHAGISEALTWLAQSASLRGRAGEARALAEDACRHARLGGDDRVLGRALLTLATRTLPDGDWRLTFDHGAELLMKVGDYRELATFYSDAAWFALLANLPNEAAEFLALGLPIAEQAGAPGNTMMIHANIGWAHLLTGNFSRARAAFIRQLQLCAEHGFRYGPHEGLAGLAALSATAGELEKAARLLGAAHALGWPATDGQPIDDRLEHDYFAPARARCGIDAWWREEQAGAIMSQDEAIAWALVQSNPTASAPDDESG